MSLEEKKERLINELIEQNILKTKQVTEAFRTVPREAFVPYFQKENAYLNYPLPIGHGQTISQPLTVAIMTEAIDVQPGQKILEIGSGSGYQAAILAECVGPSGHVITLEIVPELFDMAKRNVRAYPNVDVVLADGSRGYVKDAPYDRILIAASASEIREELIFQLKRGGKLVIPVGQEMFLVERNDTIKKQSLGTFLFVPLQEDKK